MAQLNESQTHVLTLLRQTFQHQTEKSATEALGRLEKENGYAMVMLELLAQQGLSIQDRQAAGIRLRHHVRDNWDSPLIPNDQKAQIRMALLSPTIMSEKDTKIGTQVAMIITEISKEDFPEQWPDLLQVLVNFLDQNQNSNARLSSLRVLRELSDEIGPITVQAVVPRLFPALLTVFAQKQVFSVAERDLAIKVYHAFLEVVNHLELDNSKALKTLLRPTLHDFLKSMCETLQTTSLPQSEEKSMALQKTGGEDHYITDMHLVTEVVTVLKYFVKEFPKTIKPFVTDLLTPFWDRLSEAVTIYGLRCSEPESDDPKIAEIQEMAMGRLETCLDSMLDFLSEISQSPKSISKILEPVLDKLFYALIALMQYPIDQIEKFDAQPALFAMQEDTDHLSGAWSVRITACQNFTAFLDKYGYAKQFEKALTAAQTHLSESEALRQQNGRAWWQKREAAMCAFGNIAEELVAEDLLASLPNEQAALNAFRGIVQTVLVNDINAQNTQHLPLLRARAVASVPLFAPVLPAEIQQPLFVECVKAMAKDAPLLVRLAGARSMGKIMNDLKNIDYSALIAPAIEAIVQLLMDEDVTDESVHMVLDQLSSAVTEDPKITLEAEPLISKALITVWEANLTDPVATDRISDVVLGMAQTKLCIPQLQKSLVPTIINILQNPKNFESGSITAAIMIIEQLISAFEGSELPDDYLTVILPLLAQHVLTSEDSSATEASVDCIRHIVRIAPDKIAVAKYNDTPTLDLLLRVLEKQLSIETPDSQCQSIGELVYQVFSKLGNVIGEQKSIALLLAAIERLHHTNNPRLNDSLVFVFARLCYESNFPLLDFLTQCGTRELRKREGGTEQVNVLAYVLSAWAETHASFDTPYNVKISLRALAKLVLSKDERLNNVPCKGYPIFNTQNEGVRALRSRGAASLIQFSKIAFPVKVVALHIQTWQQIQDNKLDSSDYADDDDEGGNIDVFGDDEEDDGDDGAVNISFSNGNTPFLEGDLGNVSVQDMIRMQEIIGRPLCDEEFLEDLDPEARNDPINKIDTEKYVVEFCENLERTESQLLNALFPSLSSSDQGYLKAILKKE